jgi:DNA-binding NarL/FixJ family response regulator
MADLNAVSQEGKLVVLVADATSVDTQLLVEVLRQDNQLQVIGCPSIPSAIVRLVARATPHVALINKALAPNGRVEWIEEFRAQSPATRVVMLLESSDRESVLNAFRAGAQGVFCRTESFTLLMKCIRCVHAGQIWASSSELHFVLETLVARTPGNRLAHQTEQLLSPREIDVVTSLAEGLSNRQIAMRLGLTEHTVKNYLSRIFEKLRVSSRAEVMLYALGRTSKPNMSTSSPVGRPHLVPNVSRKVLTMRSSLP